MPYLPEAINSVLSQTFTDFELLVIEDCSEDDSQNYLSSIVDSRLRIIANPSNLGMADSLNRGILLAKGEYIARLDADDICYPTRLAQQVEVLDSHPELALCGSWADIIDSDGQYLLLWRQPLDPVDVRWKLLFKNPFIHSSVMFRRQIVIENDLRYQKLDGTEDYLFWSQLMRIGEGINIDKVLIKYRRHPASMTYYNAVAMKKAHVAVANANQQSLLGQEISLRASELLLLELRMSQASIRSVVLYMSLLRSFCKVGVTTSSRRKLTARIMNAVPSKMMRILLTLLYNFRYHWSLGY